MIRGPRSDSEHVQLTSLYSSSFPGPPTHVRTSHRPRTVTWQVVGELEWLQVVIGGGILYLTPSESSTAQNAKPTSSTSGSDSRAQLTSLSSFVLTGVSKNSTGRSATRRSMSRRGTGITQHKCSMSFMRAIHARHHSHVDLLRETWNRFIPFIPPSPSHCTVLFLLLSGTTSKLLYSYAFLTHTALGGDRKVFISCQEDHLCDFT
jgi:hypothetical protein